MDTIDRSNSNLPAQFSVPLPQLAVPTLAFPAEGAGPPPLQLNPKVILRGLSRHWWKILLLCLVVSAPLMTVIWFYIQPTYEASSMLRIEPASPELFGPLRGGEGRSVPYLQTQANLITSSGVLEPVVANPLVFSIPMIKRSEDPKTDLRRRLSVEIIDDANLIRVALESTEPADAATIVNAVVESYLTENKRYNRSGNKELRESLSKQLEKLQREINSNKDRLRELVKKGAKVAVPKPTEMLNVKNDTDSIQPAFKTVSEDLLHTTMHDMVQTDLALIETEANLEVRNAANQLEREQQSQQVDTHLEERIQEEFQTDPQVVAILEETEKIREQLEQIRRNTRKANDPARTYHQNKLDNLEKKYNNLWQQKYPKLKNRLKIAAGGAPSLESIRELELKREQLRKKKVKQAELFKKMERDQNATNDDTFEASYLDYQIKRLQSREDHVERNLEELKFQDNQDKYRVNLVDAASIPRIPSNNKRFKYMAAAPVGVLFTMLGLFFLLEVKAERVADPDALSTRVRSEVYALPVLPTARSIRKRSEVETDDQIEQFIQRLDHLRFAVCGSPVELGKGRCVLITSAVGGEGKTTLAAQLAARCGNAGISTLLIDCDFHRAALCPLLDVPEGRGLSDVLNGEASIDEVAVPVQGGTFHLLPAGTPIRDTSRLLQSPNLGQLISQLRQDYDLIIIDSPPVLPVPDALILGRWSDGAVIAARYDISRFPQIERARRQLDHAGIAVLGTVINGMRHSESYYGRYTNRRRSSRSDPSNAI
jgi:polysaccharide biosynthesis transport protein